MNTVTQIRKTRAATVARVPGAIAQTLTDLEVAEGLLATAHVALGADDVDTDSAQVTLGIALDYLRNGVDRVRAMRVQTTKD